MGFHHPTFNITKTWKFVSVNLDRPFSFMDVFMFRVSCILTFLLYLRFVPTMQES